VTDKTIMGDRGEESVRYTAMKTLVFYYWDLEEYFDDVDSSIDRGDIDVASDMYEYVNHLILVDHDYVQKDEPVYIYDADTIIEALRHVIVERTGRRMYPPLVVGWIRTLIDRHGLDPVVLDDVLRLLGPHMMTRCDHCGAAGNETHSGERLPTQPHVMVGAKCLKDVNS